MTTMTRTLKALAFSTVAAAAAFGADKNSADLTPKYTTGDKAKFSYQVTRNEKSTVASVGSRARTITEEATFVMNVIEASESGTTVELTLDKVNCKVQDPSKTFEFDSTMAPTKEDKENGLLRAMRPILGSKIVFKFDAKGNMLSCTSSAELVQQSQYTQIADQLVGEQWSRFRWSPVLFPHFGPVDVGQTWTVNQGLDAASLGRFDCTLNYTLDSFNGKAAKFSSTGDMKLAPAKNDRNDNQSPSEEAKQQKEKESKREANMSPENKEKAAKAKGDASPKNDAQVKNSTVNGVFSFDAAKRFTTSCEWNEKMTMWVNAAGIEVDRDTETTVRITRVD